MNHKIYVDVESRYISPDREDEMRVWCNGNIKSHKMALLNYPYSRWYFESEEDAMAFKLRWL